MNWELLGIDCLTVCSAISDSELGYRNLSLSWVSYPTHSSRPVFVSGPCPQLALPDTACGLSHSVMKRPSDEVDQAAAASSAKLRKTVDPDDQTEAALAEIRSLKGQLLVDAVFKHFGLGTISIPWVSEQGERNIKPDPTNRPLMESLVEAYCDRIMTSGLNVDCAGQVEQIPIVWLVEVRVDT